MTDFKRTEQEIHGDRDYAEAIFRTDPDPLVVLRADLKVDRANKAFYKTFKSTPQETENVLIYELDHGQWDIPKLRQLLEEIIPRNSFFNDFEVTHEFDGIGRRTMLLNARRLDTVSGATRKIVLRIEDITQRQQAEDARLQLAAIVEFSSDAIISKNLDGIITSWNRSAERLFGYTAREAIGQKVAMLIPPDRQNEELEILRRIRRGESIDHYETVRLRKDASRLHVSLTVSPVKDAGGRVVGASKIARDITARRRAAEALRESEERYRSLFESIDEGFCVIEVLFDSQQRAIDFVYVETNPAFGKQTGIHGAQNRRVLELAPALERHWFETYGRVALTGEPVRFQDRAEVLGRWFDVYAFRVEAPELRRVAVLFTDITQQREAREALRQSEERYRTLFNLGPVAIYSIDSSGVIRDFNRRAAELWGREPAVGDSDQRFCGSFKMFRPDGSYMPHDQCPMAEVISGKISEARDAEVIIERPDGSRITALVNIRPLKNGQGEVTGAINCFYDITERLRIEGALRESKALVALKQAELQIQQQRDELSRLSRLAMLGEFSASLAHELNQPLSAIMCNVAAAQHQLSDDPPDLGEIQKTIEEIVAADHRASEIIQGLRLLYRRGSVHMQSLDLNALVRDLLKLLQHDVAKWDVDLSTELASELPAVNRDPVQLQQVLLNLVTNGCNAMTDAERKGRKLFVRTNALPEGVRVTVADSGRGIPPESLPRIFDPFYSTRADGMGLGLTVCRAIIDSHCGRLWAENNPDAGASFHFMLPAVEASGK
jgi:PAS domain S-box-containing protein